MKAFDIDGIFISDLSKWDDYYLYLRNKLCPIFEPKDNYIIISGRPLKDLEETKKWFKTFKNPPDSIFFGMSNDENIFLNINKVSIFKASILNQVKEISTFFESDINQVQQIKILLKRKIEIIHWDTFLKGKI